jgi:hypothetical protein
MPVELVCACGRHLLAKEEYSGRRTNCPECGRELLIPFPKEGTDPEVGPLPGYGVPTSGKATASLVLGLLSFCASFLTGLPAIVIGLLGIREIGRSRGYLKGQGMAIAGVVTGVLGTLVSAVLMLPALQAAREAARRAQCTNNLKEIGLSLHNFASEKGTLPPVAITDKTGKPLLSWRVAILPYLGSDEKALYQQFHLDEPWDSPHNLTLLSKMPRAYRCPSQPPRMLAGQTYYRVVSGPGTLFEPGRPIPLAAVKDGTSDTLAVIESATAVPWTQPESIPFGPGVPLPTLGGPHPKTCQILCADGSVHTVSNALPAPTLRGLITRDGGEMVTIGDF